MSPLKFACFVLLSSGCLAWGQAQQAPQQQQQVPAQVAPALRPDYILGQNDQILVRSNAEEINDRPYRVDQDGSINFPLIGRVQVAGLTVAALEQDLITRLRQFIVQPQVTITVTGFRNEPVSFFGAFRNPGVYPLTGGRTLLEMLAVVGGLQPNASRRLRVVRRSEYGPIPLASAIEDPISKTSTVEIDLNNLTQEINPVEDIVLQAYDRIIVDAAQPVYVGGEVGRPAPVDLNNRDSISVMQALTQAGGFNATASRGKVLVLRPVAGTTRLARIEVDINRILEGKENDFPLYSNDILYVGRQSVLVTLLPNAAAAMFTSLPYAILTALIR